jgi:DNA repair protein RadC
MFTITHYKIKMRQDTFHDYPVERILTWDDARLVFNELLKKLPHEEVHAVYVDGKNYILGTAMIAMGGLHGCALTPKDIFRGAIAMNAAALIIAHNHPSGDPTPSPEDIEMTTKVVDGGKLLGIPLLDHLILANGECNSILDYHRSNVE